MQSGTAKDLKLKVRYSVLRISGNANDYNIGGNIGGNALRRYAEYPFNIFC